MLDSDDLAYMRECLDDVAADMEEAVTYKRYDHTEPGDPILGTPDTPIYVDSATTAVVRELTLEEIQVSGGAYVLGDMEFKIRQTALSVTPAYADRIVYDGATYKPKSIKHSFLGGVIGWTVRAGIG